MATADEQTLVESDLSNGVLVIHRSGGDERYQITKVPAETAFLVQDAKKQILRNLKLETVLKNLARASDFLYLAYMGVVGTGELQGRISRRQKDLSELCLECVETMEGFQHDSRTVLGKLTEAYSYLLEAKEERALRIFSRCAQNSSSMSAKCEKLAGGFQLLMGETKEDAVKTCEAVGVQIKKVEALRTLKADMEANKMEQLALSNDVNKTLEDLQKQIAKEETRRDAADKHSIFGEVVGAIAGAIGGLGGLPTVTYLVSLVGSITDHSHPKALKVPVPKVKKGLGNAEQPSPLPKLKADEATAKKAHEDAMSKVTEAQGKKEAADGVVFEAKSDKKAKQSLLDAALKAKPSEAGREEKVRKAQAALDASSANLNLVLGAQEKAQADLDKAKENAGGAQTTSKAAAVALQVAERAQQISKEQSEKSKQLTNSILDMFTKKSELELLRRQANTQLAALTSRLHSNDQFTTVEQSAQAALEIATKALDNIYTSLSEAKAFWDSMHSFCEQLTDPELAEKVKDELNEKVSPEERIQYYKSERFTPSAINYLCQWAALVSVSGEYVVSADLARRSVLYHISTSPSAEEARKLMEPLQKKLMAELEADAADNTKISEEFKAGAEKMEALMRSNE